MTHDICPLCGEPESQDPTAHRPCRRKPNTAEDGCNHDAGWVQNAVCRWCAICGDKIANTAEDECNTLDKTEGTTHNTEPEDERYLDNFMCAFCNHFQIDTSDLDMTSFLNDWLANTEPEDECICNLDPEDICPVKIFNEDCPIHGFSEYTEPEDECEHTTWYGRGSISVCADCHKTYEEAHTEPEDGS